MNRVLIVAAEPPMGEALRKSLGQEGYQTAIVWTPLQMVEFCRQHSPDILVIDLRMADQGLWTAVQAVRGLGTLANVAMIGLVEDAHSDLVSQAKNAHFHSVFRLSGDICAVVEALRSLVAADGAAALVTSDDVTGRDPALNQLRAIAREIVLTSERLRDRVEEYGEDGDEHFAYIDHAGAAIRRKLNGLADFSLHDRDLRHDFRNMIASVTGFAELIMMEEGLSDESIFGLSSLREMPRTFIEILDRQKAGVSV